MSWICPHCGYENEMDPVNGRHTPLCKGCGEEYETATEVRKHIVESLKEYRLEEAALQAQATDLRGEISSLEDEISSRKIHLADMKKEYDQIAEEIKALEAKTIYGDDDPAAAIERRTARARLDIQQKTLPFEEVMA